MLCPEIGQLLDGCNWLGVPFAGGMSVLLYTSARTILVNDLHRHVINLARVVADDQLRPELIRRLRRKAFHPDELKLAQEVCSRLEPLPTWATPPDLSTAEAYFVCCWMNRAGKAGIDDEFNGRPAVRWKANGGDSVVRFQSAIRAIAVFGRVLRRCGFETMDAFEFLARCEDLPGHGLYLDPPFPEVGWRYKHNCGDTPDRERDWHARLRDAVVRFEKTRVVMRFYDHELIRALYPESEWTWHCFTGRTQANKDAPEVLLVRNGASKGLF